MTDRVALTWHAVAAVHRVQAGISTKNGAVRSILCNQTKEGEYADQVREDAIYYRVTSQTNTGSVSALKRMIGSSEPIRVFEKLGVNRWLDHNLWVVADCATEEDGHLFLLRRHETNTKPNS